MAPNSSGSGVAKSASAGGGAVDAVFALLRQSRPDESEGGFQLGVIVESSHLVSPAVPGVLNYDLNALALLFREWASEELLGGHPVATCLLTENLNDLHPIVVQNPRVARIKIPLPTVDDLSNAIDLVGAVIRPHFPVIGIVLAG